MIGSRKIKRALLGATAGVLLLCPVAASSAFAAAPAPQWTITSVSGPTNLKAGDPADEFTVTATNTGSAPTSGEITLQDTLPEGFVASAVTAADTDFGGGAVNCTLGTLTCVYSGAPIPIAVGDAITMQITVAVPSGAPESVTNVAAVSGGEASPASVSQPTSVNGLPVPFGIAPDSFRMVSSSQAAGAHPNLTTSFAFKLGQSALPAGSSKELGIDLPAGLIGNPAGIPRCTMSDVVSGTCPSAAAIGVATVVLNLGEMISLKVLVYNITPYANEPAAFAFNALFPIRLDASVRSDGDYGVHIAVHDVSEAEPLAGTSVTFWGVPAEHNGTGSSSAFTTRGTVSYGGRGGAPLVPFMTNPSLCSTELPAGLTAESWAEHTANPAQEFPPAERDSASTTMPEFGGCDSLSFEPSILTVTDTRQAGAPAGYQVDLHVPQQESSTGLATPDLKNAVVTLPAGTVVSPSAADGLQGCSDNASDPAGDQFLLHSLKPASCPAASQIGTVKIVTPLLSSPLEGQLFLGKPNCGPCSPTDAQDGNMLRLFIQAQGSGVIVKLRGSVSVNQANGQLTTTFAENPQLPFSDLILSINGGPRAPLANPQSCGPAQTTADLTPWSTPPTAVATPSSSFEVAGCAGPKPFSPAFSAGTTNNVAAAFSPLSVTFSRDDSEQELSSLKIVTPPGLLGVLKSVVQCPEPQASQGTCGAASLIGHTTDGAGPGTNPFYLGGSVYLTGPYKGAPFGLSIVVPAIAGPLDLGTVIVRATIAVDPRTSALTITSDPLPRSLDGIPLQLKVVNVTVDRPGFIFNPTNCSPQTITGTITSTSGATAAVSSRFQAGSCAQLKFKPVLTASTRGEASRGNGASLDVKISYPRGTEANIHSVAVALPVQLPSRLKTIQKACRDTVFDVNPAACPKGSLVGRGTARTPVLMGTLTGPAYLVAHGAAAFPDIVVILKGEGVTIDLTGSIEIAHKGITSSTFASVPDVPISSFDLTLPTGPSSALSTNLPSKAKYNLCGSKLTMPTTITGQNGAQIKQATKVAITGCATKKKKAAKSKSSK